MVAKKFRQIEGIFWMGVGTAIGWLAWRAHLGTFQEPGPGFVALFTGFFIFVLGLIMLLSHVARRSGGDDGPDPLAVFGGVQVLKLGYTVLLLVAYAVLLGVLGYLATTFLLMWGLLYDSQKGNWLGSALASLVIVTGSYIVFEVWLKSQLPRGVLPWW